MPPGGPVISYVMCLGLKGFVSSPVPSAAAPVASTPKLSRIRTTAYAPIATTTTRSNGIHPFLNSRNTLCLLTFGMRVWKRCEAVTHPSHTLGSLGGYWAQTSVECAATPLLLKNSFAQLPQWVAICS